MKPQRVWHFRISSSIVWRRKNLPHQCSFQRFEKAAATNNNLIFNYVIDDININIFDIYCFEVFAILFKILSEKYILLSFLLPIFHICTSHRDCKKWILMEAFNLTAKLLNVIIFIRNYWMLSFLLIWLVYFCSAYKRQLFVTLFHSREYLKEEIHPLLRVR